MSALALITIPFTIASTVITEVNRSQEKKERQNAQKRQQAVAEKQKDLEAERATQELLERQKQAQDSLRAYYFKQGIDPQIGSAKNALTAIADRTRDDLSYLEQSLDLEKQAISAGNVNRDDIFNPFPDILKLADNLNDAIKPL